MLKANHEDVATAPEPSAHRDGMVAPSRKLGFVVLASSEIPTRTGAFIPIPPSDGTRIFGRGAARADDEHPRLSAIWQRPGLNSQLTPFESPSLSRVQLRVTRIGQTVTIENVGKRTLTVNGVPARSARIAVGDVLEIGRQLVLLCVERPDEFRGQRPSYAFGEADEHGIVGESAAVWKLRREIAFVAAQSGHVLILGASGTGKELIATAVHRLSRPGQPLVARNASTFPETLIDAELYGNAKGYPNVGTSERKGLIGAAHQGSLYLDEFAELPSHAQTHLLRVMDAGEYQRLGESSVRHSDFRLIAATNRPTSALRSDVLGRFAFQINVPDLSSRREDIVLLAHYWLRTLAESDPKIAARFTAEQESLLGPHFVALVTRLPLEGNVRELRRLLWQAMAPSDTDAFGSGEILTEASAGNGREIGAQQIQAALAANDGSLEKTWRTLGLSNRFALMRLMKKNTVKISRQPRTS